MPLSLNSLHWLQELLKERFNAPFQLILRQDQRVEMKICGDDGRILFAPTPTYFLTPGAAPTACTFWDPSYDGFTAPCEEKLPIPQDEKSAQNNLIRLVSKECHIDFDILGLIYWKLNLLEEIGSPVSDKHGRFRAGHSHAVKYKYLERPIVDEWLLVLKQAMQRLWPGISFGENRFTVSISHDVDRPARYQFCSWPEALRRMTADLLRRRHFRSAFTAPLSLFARAPRISDWDSHNTFGRIMAISEKLSLKSAFYFLSGATNQQYDGDYQLNDLRIRNLMKEIHIRGHEIGLHPSYDTINLPDALKAEAGNLFGVCRDENIKQERWGARMHYLRWRHPDTLASLSSVGIDYDHSLTHAEMAGFRCGTCHEYPAFNPITDHPLPIRVKPLVAMASSIIDYMGLGETQAALDYFRKLRLRCRQVRGDFSVLWHNSELLTPKQWWLYTEVLTA